MQQDFIYWQNILWKLYFLSSISAFGNPYNTIFQASFFPRCSSCGTIPVHNKDFHKPPFLQTMSFHSSNTVALYYRNKTPISCLERSAYLHPTSSSFALIFIPPVYPYIYSLISWQASIDTRAPHDRVDLRFIFFIWQTQRFIFASSLFASTRPSEQEAFRWSSFPWVLWLGARI